VAVDGIDGIKDVAGVYPPVMLTEAGTVITGMLDGRMVFGPIVMMATLDGTWTDVADGGIEITTGGELTTTTVETTVVQIVAGGTMVVDGGPVGFGTVVYGTTVVGLNDDDDGVTIYPPTNCPLTQVQFYGK
jgi:hypothetical protein